MSPKKSTPNEDCRARVWAAVVYPDSAPENWRQLLDDQHIEWAESPLHGLDVNESTGELKKAHWHIVLAFDGKKSFEQVSAILAPCNGPIPQRCASIRGAVRYMAHLDNPEKAQYSPSEIVSHGGFDVASYLAISESEKKAIVSDIFDWVRETGCVEFCDLLDFARDVHPDTWFDVLTSGYTLVFSAYFKSLRGKRNPALQRYD